MGQSKQVVEVTELAPTVELATSAISGIVEGSEVRELPLNGRDWASLATFQPGVVSVRTQGAGATDWIPCSRPRSTVEYRWRAGQRKTATALTG